jgi:serpin B
MTKVLRLGPNGDGPPAVPSEFKNHLRSVGNGENRVLSANSLWAELSEPLLPAFQDLISREFSGVVKQVDFRHDSEGARRTINQWVETQTDNRITELVPLGGLSAETSLALVNAIYFKGLWASPFETAETEKDDFYLETGGKVKAPLMSQEEVVVLYQDADGFQAIDLAYEGNELSMLVLLPKRKNGLGSLEKRLSAPMLQACVGRLRRQPVRLFLPRFRFSWGTADLRAPLENLGMAQAFSFQEADFSGMNGKEPPSVESLYLSAVFHQAFLEVTERGTRAAAATAAMMMPRSSLGPSLPRRIPVFRADHPFLFAIRDRKSNSFLFLGRLSDPTQEG